MSDYTAGLRQVADFLDEHPELVEELAISGQDFGIFLGTAEEAAGWIRRIGGTFQKAKVGGYYELRRQFGPHKVTINVAESVICERVVVGTRTVEKPDPDAPMVEVEEEVVEWRCPPVLAES